MKYLLILLCVTGCTSKKLAADNFELGCIHGVLHYKQTTIGNYIVRNGDKPFEYEVNYAQDHCHKQFEKIKDSVK
jgi:hypothetical protein